MLPFSLLLFPGDEPLEGVDLGISLPFSFFRVLGLLSASFRAGGNGFRNARLNTSMALEIGNSVPGQRWLKFGTFWRCSPGEVVFARFAM